MDIKVGFIGGGTMGKALGFSMLKKKLLCPSNIYVSGPNIKNLEPWKSVGVTQLIDNNYDLVKYCQIIFICVEPHVFEVMANDFKKDYIDKPMTLAHIVWVSIMSGVSLNILKSELGFYSNAKIIRTLPNLAVAVGHGALVYAPGEHVTKDEMDKVKSLLEPIASCFQLPEGLLNAAGAVSGSGPAFAFMVSIVRYMFYIMYYMNYESGNRSFGGWCCKDGSRKRFSNSSFSTCSSWSS